MKKKLATREEALGILISGNSKDCTAKRILTVIAQKSTDDEWMKFISQDVHPHEGLEYPAIKLNPEEAQLLKAGQNLSSQEILAVL